MAAPLDVAAAAAGAATFGESHDILQAAGRYDDPPGAVAAAIDGAAGQAATSPFAAAATFGESYDLLQAAGGIGSPAAAGAAPINAAANAALPQAFEIDEAWEMPRNAKYEGMLCDLMTFLHGRPEKYAKGTTFTRDALLQIKPQHIHNWLAMKAYKKVDFDYNAGDRPIHYRASSLEQLKKGISFFMPNNHPQWCNGQGNPTKSSVITKMIAQVKLCEVRKEGAPSRVKRPLTQAEFRKMLELLRKHGDEKSDYSHSVKYPAMCLWQYHLVGRVDDTAHFEIQDPRSHDAYPGLLKTRVRWSKNVRDEQACPPQILFGSAEE